MAYALPAYLRKAMTLMHHKAGFAQGANSWQNGTYPETREGFAVIFGAFVGLASFPIEASVCATQVSVRQGEAASVASYWRARAA